MRWNRANLDIWSLLPHQAIYDIKYLVAKAGLAYRTGTCR
jgi:hypothetical protein